MSVFKTGLISIANYVGIDRTIFYTLLSRFFQIGGSVLTLFLISKCLTKQEQGYYYTFTSLLGIQIFFELGMSNIITQFVAHEFAGLSWDSNVSFTGSKEKISRLSSLLHFTIKWYLVIAICLLIGLFIGGFYFFNSFGKESISITWKIPWLILSLSTSISLMITPILAFFEGLGKIREVAKIRFLQQICQLFLILTFFSVGLKLFSSPLSLIVSFFIVPIWLFLGDKKKLLIFIWNNIGIERVNYRKEIFPFQWKIALSWISGYFIFQLFNIVLFATEGPVVAGQMGMTLSILNSILAFSLSWINTKISIFSGLIASKQFLKLDNLFKRTLIQSTGLNIVAVLAFFLTVSGLYIFKIKINGDLYRNRFLPAIPMLFMMIPIILNHIGSAMATYLRCHKKEPMLIQSLTMGVLCALSTIYFGKIYGVFGMTLGNLILSIIGIIWTYFIFIENKRKWHNE